jgi:hypothetical protein
VPRKRRNLKKGGLFGEGEASDSEDDEDEGGAAKGSPEYVRMVRARVIRSYNPCGAIAALHALAFMSAAVSLPWWVHDTVEVYDPVTLGNTTLDLQYGMQVRATPNYTATQHTATQHTTTQHR